MRTSDLCSDVCSSDLTIKRPGRLLLGGRCGGEALRSRRGCVPASSFPIPLIPYSLPSLHSLILRPPTPTPSRQSNKNYTNPPRARGPITRCRQHAIPRNYEKPTPRPTARPPPHNPQHQTPTYQG